MFVVDDHEFSFVWIKIQFHTVHLLLDRNKTLSQIYNTGVKIAKVYYQEYLGVIGDSV